MKKTLKISLFLLLALALFPAGASIVKIVLTNYDPEDISWDLVNVEIWNMKGCTLSMSMLLMSLARLASILAELTSF